MQKTKQLLLASEILYENIISFIEDKESVTFKA